MLIRLSYRNADMMQTSNKCKYVAVSLHKGRRNVTVRSLDGYRKVS